MKPYSLDKEKSLRCPQCGTDKFHPYVFVDNGTMIGEKVGVCDNVRCCYSLSPGEFEYIRRQIISKRHIHRSIGVDYVDDRQNNQYYISSYYTRGTISNNSLFQFLENYIDKRLVKKAFCDYHVETSLLPFMRYASIFYYKNKEEKIMMYRIAQFREGHMVKEDIEHPRTRLISSPENQCLFGRHLLKDGSSEPVCIVESEKSAIVASIFYPEAIWLASGSSWFLENKFIGNKIDFKLRKIYLFPEADQEGEEKGDWRRIFPIIKKTHPHTYICRYTYERTSNRSYDIADYVLDCLKRENEPVSAKKIEEMKRHGQLATFDEIIRQCSE